MNKFKRMTQAAIFASMFMFIPVLGYSNFAMLLLGMSFGLLITYIEFFD